MSNKLLAVGLDGATFRIIKPMVEEGRLPTLEKLLKQGSHGVLESTMDTNSPCAWSSFITGKNPGKHGIFGFFENAPDNHGVQFINGSFRNGKSLWKVLSEYGKKVGVVNVPISYPAEEVNGFMISGPDSPKKSDARFTFPSDIIKEIENDVGEYIIEAGASALVRQGKPEEALSKLYECIESKVSTVKYLLKKEDYDFFMVVFTESDRVQHHFWKYINPRHPAYTSPEKEKFGGAIYDIYEKLDVALGEIINTAGEDYSVLVMSDHGFGPTSNKTFFINQWLESIGYLNFKSNVSVQDYTKNSFEKLLSKAYVFARTSLNRKWKRRLRNFMPGLKNSAHSILLGSNIDWENTAAFSWENASTIYINLKGKYPTGCVEGGEEYEKVREDIIHKLLELTSLEDKEIIVDKVLKKEEVYWGPYIDKAPDLFINWKDDEYTVRPGYAGKNNSYIEVVEKDNLERVETISRASGIHKQDGIFLFCGNGINRDGIIKDIHLYDVTSTILYYLGVPILDDFDGKVVKEVFTESFLNKNSISYSESTSESSAFDANYSENESRIIAERLKGLGYID